MEASLHYQLGVALGGEAVARGEEWRVDLWNGAVCAVDGEVLKGCLGKGRSTMSAGQSIERVLRVGAELGLMVYAPVMASTMP